MSKTEQPPSPNGCPPIIKKDQKAKKILIIKTQNIKHEQNNNFFKRVLDWTVCEYKI